MAALRPRDAATATRAEPRADLASERPGTDATVTSEDTAAPVPAAWEHSTAGVPRGDDAPSGHGRVHTSAVHSDDRTCRHARRAGR